MTTPRDAAAGWDDDDDEVSVTEVAKDAPPRSDDEDGDPDQ